MKTKTGKRIVSKGEYLLGLTKKVWLLYGAVFMLVLVPFGLLLVVGGWWRNFLPGWLVLIGVLVLVQWIPFCGGAADKMFKKVQQHDPGVLITHVNTADLPAPDTLVRASSEPRQAQEAVLLRAAGEGQETPPEQLVRPAGGAEQRNHADI